MPRIMIINWKFKNKDKATGNKKEYEIVDCENAKLICCNYDSDKLKDLKNLINENNNNEILLLLHTNYPNNIHKADINQSNDSFKIFEFEGGNKQVYYSAKSRPLGLLGEITLNDNALNGSKIKKENFDFVWNFYYNTLEKKQKIYKLLNDSKRNNYIIENLYNELKNDDKKFKKIENIAIKKLQDIENNTSTTKNGNDLESKYNEIRNWLETLPGEIY